jgi:putative glutathione S-transferase
MGLLINGRWRDQWYDTGIFGGHFVRKDSRFRSWVTGDGRPGLSSQGGFKLKPAATISM